MLIVSADYLHSYRRRHYASGSFRVVLMDSCIPVLPVQGFQKGGTLDDQSSGNHHIDLIRYFPVRSRMAAETTEDVADNWTGSYFCPL